MLNDSLVLAKISESYACKLSEGDDFHKLSVRSVYSQSLIQCAWSSEENN